MKRLFYFLMFLASITTIIKAQESHWRFENNGNDEMGNHNLIPKNGANYSTTNFLEGLRSGNFNLQTKNRFVTSNKIDLGSGGLTIVVNFLKSGSSGIVSLMGNRANGAGAGFVIILNMTNHSINFNTYNNSNVSNSAYTGAAAWTNGSWNTLAVRIMDTDVAYASLFVNGVKNTSDSTIQAGWTKNDTISIGAERNGAYTLYGNVDNVQIYKCALSDAKINELYTKRNLNFVTRCASSLPISANLTHDQSAVIPDNAVANDYVVELNYNREWEIRTSMNYSFVSGNSSLFKVENGILKINNPAGLTPGTYNVVVRATDSIFTGTATVTVNVVSAVSSVFIDPATTSFANTTLVSGTNYFIKRGTTSQLSTSASKNMVSNTVIGAYGQGARPVLNNTGNYNYLFRASGGVSNVTFRDIEVKNNGGITGMFYAAVGGNTSHIKIINTIWDGGSRAYNILRFFNSASLKVLDSEIKYALDDGIYAEGISGSSSSDKTLFIGNYIHHVNMEQDPDSIGKSSGDCIQTGGFNNRIYIAHNLFDRTNNVYKHCLIISSTNPTGITDHEIIIEYNRMEATRTPNLNWGCNNLTLRGVRGTIVRYNIMNWGHRNIFTDTHSAGNPNSDLKIYANLLNHSIYSAIDLRANCGNSQIYNNTIIDYAVGSNAGSNSGIQLDAGMSGTIYILNNIFYNSSSQEKAIIANNSPFSEDYNLFWPNVNITKGAHSILANPNFVHGYFSPYQINTISPAYHAGTNLSIPTDITGNNYNNPPSLGAYEYIPSVSMLANTYGTKVNEVYSLKSYSWKINSSGLSSGYHVLKLTNDNGNVFKRKAVKN